MSEKLAGLERSDAMPPDAARVELFEPPMCCSTGLCGPTIDQTLLDLNEMVLTLKAEGVGVERYQMTTNSNAFLANSEVMRFVREQGSAALPITTVRGKVVKVGAYPSLSELRIALKAQLSVTRSEEDHNPSTAKRAPSLFTQAVAELVAIGAAIAANCEPCFKYHYDQARKLGVSREEMLAAVRVGQSVKEAPARSVLVLAERYLSPEAAPGASETTQAATGVSGGCCEPATSATPGSGTKCC